ncbi:MAG: EAL domain-containing protein [Leptolyngbyaceae cyanobacterium bins.349]|nr:EAL domain-containing protein [Leptolyngbyaceae cyanobacterium bins.349]
MQFKRHFGSLAVKVTFIYGLLSSLWLLLTNPVLERLTDDPDQLVQMAALRGAVLAVVGSILLYKLIRQGEQQTQQSLVLLQAVIEGTTDAVFVKDIQGRYVLVNSTTTRLFGQLMSDVIGKDDYQLLSADQAAIVQAVDREVLTNRQAITLEETLQFHGQTRTYSSTKYPWYNKQGQLLGLIGVARDITANKQLEQERTQLVQELQQRNRSLEALNTVTANAISSLEIDVLLRTLLHRLVTIIPAQAGVIFLQSDQGLMVRAIIGDSFAQSFEGRALSLRLVQAIAASPHLLHIPDLQQDPRFADGSSDRHSTRSLLGIPLKRHDQLIGVLLVEWDTPQPYDEQRVRLLEITAERCAMAVLNAQLYEQTKQLQERLQLQIDRMPMGLIINDQDGYLMEWNPAAERIFGYARSEVLGQQVADLLAPTQLQSYVAEINQRAFEAHTSHFSINPNLTKDGRTILCEWHNTPLRDADGTFVGILAMVQDVTERQQAADRLRESEARFRSLIDSLPFCCWAIDTDGRYTFQNAVDVQQWGDMIGQLHEDVIANAGGSLDHWQDHRRRGLIETLYDEAEYVINDETKNFLSIVAPVRDRDRTYGLVGVSIDITERKRAEAQLRRYAFYDILTGLPQRTILLERLADLMQACKMGRDRPFALLHLDLVGFKMIKYSLGHQLAEALVIAMAERLKTLLPPDAMLTRTGGADEFSILLENLEDFEAAIYFAESLLQHLATPFQLGAHELFVNTSIGIVFSSHCDCHQNPDVEEFFRAADTAMHQARQAGVGKYAVFDPSTQVQAIKRLQLDSELRHAIAQEELFLHYQPIINLSTRQLTGFEALVRWQSPQRGMVSPAEFIPLAEETGLIIALGNWVLRRACEQLRQWHDRFAAKAPLTISVNLSTVQLLQPDLLHQVDQILQETQAPAHRLKLEITETSIVQNAQQVTPILQALKARQIQLSIDDFGTGYSSLTYLHTFPLDTLKVDRAFVSGIGTHAESLEITRTIILLAHTLNMDVVAEGIETNEQMEQLQLLQCDRGQGCLFSRPLPVAAAEELLMGDRWLL